VGLERGPLSLLSTTDELLGRKSSGSGLENREYGRRNPSCWPRGTLYPQTFALTSPTTGGRSVGIVCSRSQATGFSLVLVYDKYAINKSRIIGRQVDHERARRCKRLSKNLTAKNAEDIYTRISHNNDATIPYELQ
jgi:hypothetical protein